MGTTKIDVAMPSVTSLFNTINQIIGDSIHSNLIKISTQIQQEHGVDISKYTNRVALVIDSSRRSSKTGRSVNRLDPSNQCRARTANKTQCSRRHKKDQIYCGCHEHHQPNGTIDDIDESVIPSVFKDCDLLRHNGRSYTVYENTIYLLPSDTEAGAVIDQSSLVPAGMIKDGVPHWSDHH